MLASRFQTKKLLSNQKFAIYNVKNEVSFHLCKYQPWYKTLQIATNHKLKAVYSLSCSSAHFAVFPFLLHILPLPLPLATLLIIVWSSSVLYWAIKILKKKSFCNGWLFLGNLDPLSLTQGGPTVPLVCGFRRQDNLLA